MYTWRKFDVRDFFCPIFRQDICFQSFRINNHEAACREGKAYYLLFRR